MRKRGRGFLVWETMVGLLAALALLMVIAVAVTKQRRNEGELAARRAAVRQCEEALMAMRMGEKGMAEARVELLVEKAPAGMRWVRVEATVKGKTERMVGLVPEGVK